MYKTILLPAAAAIVAFAQAPTITSGPFMSAATTTRSTAGVIWTTDIAATSKTKWGLSSGSLTHLNDNQNPNYVTPLHSWYMFGTPPDTTIWYSVCSTANNAETCSPPQSYTTPAQAQIPADPVPPVPVDTPVVPTGTIWTVGPDCNSSSTGLVAMWKAAIADHNPNGEIIEIDPAITPYCAGSYTFPAGKWSGPPYILTRMKGADTLFPNHRRANLADKPKMARFVHNAPNINMIGGADPTGEPCFGGNLRWRQYQNNVWALYRCNNINPRNITSITSSGTLRLTVPNHGYSEGAFVWVSGATGPGTVSSNGVAVNGAWRVHVIDANTIEPHWSWDMYGDLGAMQAFGAAGGGTVSLYKFQLEPVHEFTTATPSGACNWGEWWHKSASAGNEDEYHRTWYCDASDELLPLRLDPAHYNPTMPVIDIATNKVNYVMFQGLNLEPMHLKADPQQVQYQYNPHLYPSGTMFYSFLGQTIYNDHVYWDNLVAGCPDPSLSGEIERCDALALELSGTHIHVGGSYLYGFQVFHATLQGLTMQGDYGDDSAVTIPVYQGGPFEASNNYINCAGICLYASDDETSFTTTHDWTITRNTIETPDKYWDPNGSLLSNGFFFSQRHRAERKRMVREEDNGNIFIGGWVWNNNAAGFCLCTRTGQAFDYVAVSGTSIAGTEPSATSHGWMFTDVQVGDKVSFFYNPSGCSGLTGKIYTVTAVADYTHLSITPDTGCTGYSGGMVRLFPRASLISDVYIHNHTWLRNPTDLVWLGHDSYPSNIGAALQRIKLNNNLSVGLNGMRVGHGTYYAIPYSAPSGSHLNLGEGGEDFQESHETVIGRTEYNHLVMDYQNGGYSQASGLVMRDNITEYLTYAPVVDDGVAKGQAFFDREWVGTTPAYTLLNNVLLRQGGCGAGGPGHPYGYPEDPCQGPPWGPYPSGFFWYDTNSGPFPFFDPAGNYRLKSGSAYASGGAKHASDGLDAGVDMDALEAAQGNVSNVRVFNLSSTAASIGFLAPDAVGCPVDWSTNNFATFSRISNAGGTRTQNVQAAGLPAHSTISYRINCVVMQPTGTFSTP